MINDGIALIRDADEFLATKTMMMKLHITCTVNPD